MEAAGRRAVRRSIVAAEEACIVAEGGGGLLRRGARGRRGRNLGLGGGASYCFCKKGRRGIRIPCSRRRMTASDAVRSGAGQTNKGSQDAEETQTNFRAESRGLVVFLDSAAVVNEMSTGLGRRQDRPKFVEPELRSYKFPELLWISPLRVRMSLGRRADLTLMRRMSLTSRRWIGRNEVFRNIQVLGEGDSWPVLTSPAPPHTTYVLEGTVPKYPQFGGRFGGSMVRLQTATWTAAHGSTGRRAHNLEPDGELRSNMCRVAYCNQQIHKTHHTSRCLC